MTNVTHIKTQIAVQSDSLIADATFMNLLAAARQQEQMVKTQLKLLDILRAEIKQAMGEHVTVISPQGAEAATYNWRKGSETVDKEALKIHFADVYDVVKKTSEPTRVLILK